MGAGTLLAPIERAGWGSRRRDRGKGTGLAGGVLNRQWTVFSCGMENMRALTWRFLLAASNGLLDWSGSSPSRTNHQGLLGVEGPDSSEGQAVFKCTRIPAGRNVQSEKPVSCEERWVRQAVVQRCQNNEFNMKVGFWAINWSARQADEKTCCSSVQAQLPTTPTCTRGKPLV